MKKSVFTLLALSSMLLTSCGANQTFYGKVFSYQNECFYNMSVKDYTIGKTYEEIITLQMAAGNVNWDQSGAVAGFIYKTVVPFTSHSTYQDVINSMVSMSKPLFDAEYEGFKLETSDYKNHTARVTYKSASNTYNMVGGNEGKEDDTTIYLKNLDNETVGELTLPVGADVINGKYSCVQFSLGITNRIKFSIAFNTAVAGKTSFEWYCYAKIAN